MQRINNFLGLRISLACAMGFMASAAPCRADDAPGMLPNPTTPSAPVQTLTFAGRFANEKLALDLRESPDGYSGTIALGSNSFPAKATLIDGQLSGSFNAGGQDFPFTATRAGDVVTLISGSKTYTLNRADAAPITPVPANPVQSGPAAPAAEAAQVVHFVPYSVQDDPQYLGGEAMTLLIPAGWKVEGGIEWKLETTLMCQPHLRVYDPNSLDQVAFYPSQGFYWSPRNPASQGQYYMGSEIEPPVQDQFEALSKVVIPRFRPDLANAKVVETEKLPEVAKAYFAANQPRGNYQAGVEAGRMRMEYDLNGQTVQEDFFVIYTAATNIKFGFTDWGLVNVVSVRAAKGALDKVRPIANTVFHSKTLALPWYNQIQQLVVMRNQANLRAIAQAGKMADIRVKLSHDISDITKKEYESKQANDEKVSESRAETNRDEQPWMTTGGKKIELPFQYGIAWQGVNGEIISTNDAGYNPNSDPNKTTTYTRLAKAPGLNGQPN